jgi:membrane protein YqaA with SNARE-associated domain
MRPFLVLFLVVLLLNIIPAFAPPTWMVFSFLGFRLPTHMDWSFALVGAVAATMGRSLLGKLSRIIIRNRWLSDAAKQSINSLKPELEKRPNLTFGLFLFYAFTPLPSNYLFIAYGLTTMPLIRLVAPFFIGRFVSYYFWTMSAAAVSRKLELEETDAMAYFSVYFVLTQFALLGVVYVFMRVDWKLLLQKRKWRWLPKSIPDLKSSSSRY